MRTFAMYQTFKEKTDLSAGLRVVRRILLVCLCILSSSCFRERPLTVQYVFPDGFHGIAKLQSHQPTGVTLVPVNGVITLNFPPSGEIRISGELPTVGWHKPIARYQNGKTIGVVEPPNSVSDSDIALRPLGLKDNVEDWYLVGTATEIRAALARKNGFDFKGQH
jgi:hypothetical protein